MNGVAPLLVIAVGNPSRGDDALGPALLDALAEALRGPLGQALQAQGRAPQAEVELLGDFQLQVEHALDLAGRRAVLFIDASLAPVPEGAALTPLQAADGDPPMSHALRPQALLAVARRVLPAPPPRRR